MTVQTITTTGRGLSPTKTTSVNRRADAIMDNEDGAAGVLLWDGLYRRPEAAGAWTRRVLQQATRSSTGAQVIIRPGTPMKLWERGSSRDNAPYFVMPWTPSNQDTVRYIRLSDGGLFGRPNPSSSLSAPSNYLGLGNWAAYSERDWMLFSGNYATAVRGVCAKADESRLVNVGSDSITDTKYLIVYKPSGNRLEAAVGSQSALLDDNVTGDSDYDICSATTGGTRFWTAAIVEEEVRLWSVQLSLAVSSYSAAFLPELREGNRKLLVCAFPSGNVGACVIGYGTGGRPDVFVAAFNSLNDSWSSWERLNNDSDWSSVRPENWVAWSRYPATDTFRLAMTRGTGANNTTRIYETPSAVNREPDAPSWVSPESGSAHGRATPLTLRWQFNDPDPGDTQSAYSIRRITNTGTSYRTAMGWQGVDDGASKLTGPATSLTLTTPWASEGDGTHQYNARSWDSADLVSTWSQPLAINHGDADNPTIIEPLANAEVDQRATLTWTSDSQSSYRVELREGATVTGRLISDSGRVLGDGRVLTVVMDATGVTRTIVLYTWAANGVMSAVRSVTVTTSFSLPLLPTITLIESDADSAIAVVVAQATITPGSQAPAVEEWSIERRDSGNDDTIINIATGLPADSTTYTDRTPQHQAEYDYRVTVKGDDRSNTTGWVT